MKEMNPWTSRFNLAKEVEKISKLLLLPVTHVVFNKKYKLGKAYRNDKGDYAVINAKLYVNDDLVGTIPYMSEIWGFMYDPYNAEIFAWKKIYAQFEQLIFNKICLQEPLAVAAEPWKLGPGHYLILDIKDKAGMLIKRATCRFIDDEWNVFISGLDTGTIRKRVRVVLTPPPSPGSTDIQKSPQ